MNGDTYAVTVRDGSGALLAQISRPVQYDNVETCQSYSKQARLELYPTSASNLECSNAYCSAGVKIEGDLSTNDLMTPLAITLCRNHTLCATGTVPVSSLATGAVQQEGGLDGDFLASVGLQRSGGGVSFEIDTIEDSAALADGDVYALAIAQGASSLLSQQVTATYSVSYPNGSACEPVPCRQATLDFR